MDKKLSHYLQNANFRQKKKQNKDRPVVSTESDFPDMLTVRNGHIVLDDTAMYTSAREYNAYEVSDDSYGIVTSSTFRKPRGKTHWTDDDNKLFYEALMICGMEFTLISELFPEKTRKQVKRKFLKEEKFNKRKIDSILNRTQKFDRDAYNSLKNRVK